MDGDMLKLNDDDDRKSTTASPSETQLVNSIQAGYGVCELHSPLEEAAFLSFPYICDDSSGAHSVKVVVDEMALACVDPIYISKTKAVTEANIIVKDYGRSGTTLELWGSFEAVRKAFISVVLRLRRHNFKLSSEELASGVYEPIDPARASF
ncbi:hypothetical protein Bca52824_054623 [Brassica carinata]|uniref:Uncharacterized protein n=1 Tax=Brassica carinata TaxID=52824 RepID=A0A8X7R635_BRACI|nr:hypothetical protein Bca52824_054623 [Brassica carinata]